MVSTTTKNCQPFDTKLQFPKENLKQHKIDVVFLSARIFFLLLPFVEIFIIIFTISRICNKKFSLPCRDNLKKTNKTLRHLITELLRYFTKCEDELNNTLVDELLKHGFDKSISQLEGDLEITDLKRVHLAPDFTEFLNILDASSVDQKDLSLDLKNELELCLEKLKADANAILAASVNVQAGKPSIENVQDEKLSSLKRQLINETHLKNDLNARLLDVQSYVASLESEKEELEKHNELLLEKQKVLEVDLGKAHDKIAELIENGHKEVVSEGYGEKIAAHRSDSSKWKKWGCAVFFLVMSFCV